MIEAIELPGLGGTVDLGQLYDARNGTYFAGMSPWDASHISSQQIIRECPRTMFSHAVGVEEVFKKKGLDIEGSVSVSFGLFSVSGSASVLQQSKSNLHEASVTIVCKYQNRVRILSMETLQHVTYQNVLKDSRYTHFVAEVEDGGWFGFFNFYKTVFVI